MHVYYLNYLWNSQEIYHLKHLTISTQFNPYLKQLLVKKELKFNAA